MKQNRNRDYNTKALVENPLSMWSENLQQH